MKRKLGDTGIEVFPVGLGAMPLSIRGRPDTAKAETVIGAALSAGVEFIDTANCYCIDNGDTGHNERLIRESLKQHPDHAPVVATKGGLTRPEGRWERDGRPESLRRACEQSLRDLGVETITLYQYHAPDPEVPFEDSVGELARLREQGKIQHVGLSNVDTDQIAAARRIVPVASVQNRCNVLHKHDVANGLIDYCGVNGITYLPYSPVGGGNGHKRLPEVGVLADIAARLDVSVYAVALAWLLSKGAHVIPIPGASRPASIEDSAKSVHLRLSDQDIAALDGLPE